jgi:colanic acid biosynthesis glycosyl transferase WcaI
VCLHGGNLGQKQGLDNVLDAAALLRGDGVRIVFAGDGNDRARLQAKARELQLDNVDFIDMQGPGRWEEIMQASDVLLVNQRASVADMSLPSKLTSYFAAGRPVVAAASEGSETAREMEAARAGHVVPPENAAALRDAIAFIKGDSLRASEIGESAKRYAATHLSPERALSDYEAWVSAIATHRARQREAPPRRSG